MRRRLGFGVGGSATLALFAAFAAACGSEADTSAPAPPAQTTGGTADAGAAADTPRVESFARVAAGGDVACALATSGALRCWGGMAEPTPLETGSVWRQVAVSGQAGGLPVCALRSDDTLWCWSDLTMAPSQPSNETFGSVGNAGSNHCAVTIGGALVCWGTSNAEGALGTGDTAARAAPVRVGSDADWKRAAPGAHHSCAIKRTGALHCWGANAHGQLGDGTQTARTSPAAVDAAQTYLDVSPGADATCAVRSDGSLVCWGDGLTPQPSTTPVAVDPWQEWTKVAVGTNHACALKRDGSLHCWGKNDRGQLGLPAAVGSKASPQRVGIDFWVDVAVGDGFSCATKKDGTAQCWGANGRGQLGREPLAHLAPKRIGAAGEFASANAGPSNVCAVKTAGSLLCWGAGGGLPNLGQSTQLPFPIGNATDWKEAKPGAQRACATKADGSLHCWATGTEPASTTLTVTAFDVGLDHQCAIASGSLYCWGAGAGGKLGNGSSATLDTPTKVGAADWSAVAASGDATCAVKADGTLWCFGLGFTGVAQQGQNDTWTAIDQTPAGHGFFGLAGGGLYGWDATRAVTSADAGSGWVAIATGAGHVCGIAADHSLWCKGDNARGQLGDGTRTSREAMTRVGTATDWNAVTAGSAFTCGLRGAGDLYCWGSNDFGEMGDGTSWKNYPVEVP